MLTLEQLRRIMPQAGKRAAVHFPYLQPAFERWEITTPDRQGMFLANLAHESNQFIYMQELASGRAYDKRKDLGNTKPEAIRIAAAHGSTPGPWWKGHGPIQVTGYDNHLACGEALELDLLNEPLLITKPEYGCLSAGWFWKTSGLNEIADEGDFDGTCAVVNTGNRHTPPTRINGYAERLAYWERARVVLA